MILDIASTCSAPALASFLSVAKKILLFVQLIGPLICIISLTISFINVVVNPDEKKEPAKIKNKIIALIIMFFVPVFVNANMALLDNSKEFSRCWNDNSKVLNNGESYITTEGSNNKVNPAITNPGDYEKGNERTNNSTGNNSSNSNNDNGNTNANQEISKIVFIGDSRTVQMYAFLTNDWSGANYSSGGVHNVDGDIFVAQGSMGLDWMKSTGISAAKQYFNSSTAIVILMGVNDLHNIDNYISYVKENYSSWTSNGSSLYFATVNPCSGSYSYLNSSIDEFNSKLKNGLPSSVKIIDTNSYLVSNGYKTTDGLHYDKSTSDMIYNYIKNNV